MTRFWPVFTHIAKYFLMRGAAGLLLELDGGIEAAGVLGVTLDEVRACCKHKYSDQSSELQSNQMKPDKIINEMIELQWS
jgi:hypothetical protein